MGSLCRRLTSQLRGPSPSKEIDLPGYRLPSRCLLLVGGRVSGGAFWRFHRNGWSKMGTPSRTLIGRRVLEMAASICGNEHMLFLLLVSNGIYHYRTQFFARRGQMEGCGSKIGTQHGNRKKWTGLPWWVNSDAYPNKPQSTPQ